jgi:signal transduction histidine kinase
VRDRRGAQDGNGSDAPPLLSIDPRRLLEAVDRPVVLLTTDGRLLHVTDAAARLLALDADELRGTRFDELSERPQEALELLRLWAGSAGLRPGTLDLTVGPRAPAKLRCDGARLDADTLLVRFRTELEPDPLAQLSREVETASLRELQARLQLALHELEDANRQLATRNTELERYASAVAHDLRSPLYVIRGYVELLVAGQVTDVDAETTRLLTEVLRGADRMSAVIDGLLAVARLQVSSPTEPADSAAALGVVIAELRDEVEATGARVEVDPLPAAWAGFDHLVQVFVNLLSNSLKFGKTDSNPRIRVSGRRLQGVTEFVVEDDGIGVPVHARERIFDIFDRGEAPADRPGTGIGLATSRKIVESYGGEIRCEQSPLGGARFVFTIADPSPSSPTPSADAPPMS